ncbi:hypothetical protein C8J55DRAFT_560473 [Lentinula edodes]|uniref:Uncharacterized protein n=1 Tax=Lentinula lateritia TaxID=40482 RepID=A0A9W9AF79_9AGAR|nr:hypothetical protein C8J55DRAFT_560473 [Lentinula edodes]
MPYNRYAFDEYFHVHGDNPIIDPYTGKYCADTLHEDWSPTTPPVDEFDTLSKTNNSPYNPASSRPPAPLGNNNPYQNGFRLPPITSFYPPPVLDQSRITPPLSQLKPTPTSPGKENEGIQRPHVSGGPEAGKKVGARIWTAKDLIELAKICVEYKPFLQPYGKKGKVWDKIFYALSERGFRLSKVPALSLRHKAESLVGYWKNPSDNNSSVKAIAKILDNSMDKITIAALMDSVEAQWDEAKNKSDKAKADIQKKQDEDNEGGEAIRMASMQAFRSHKRDAKPLDDEDTDTDTDNNSGSRKSGTKRKFSDSNVTKSHKRQRSSVRRTSNNTKILDFLESDAEERRSHQDKVVMLMERGQKLTQEHEKEVASILHGFLELDRARFEQERRA